MAAGLGEVDGELDLWAISLVRGRVHGPCDPGWRRHVEQTPERDRRHPLGTVTGEVGEQLRIVAGSVADEHPRRLRPTYQPLSIRCDTIIGNFGDHLPLARSWA